MGTKPPAEGEPPKDTVTNERRGSGRRSVVDSHLITVDLAFQSGALLLDLSETGMGVQALASAPIGTSTPIHFELPETGGRVDGVGRIAWTDNSGRLGIRFEKLGEQSRQHLARWLSSNRRPLVAPGPNVALPSWPPPHTRDELTALRRDLSIEKPEGDAALGLVVERMRNVTRATGAVIALEEEGHILCRASSGNAPGIGARVDRNSGLSGECVRTGQIVRCEDTETDPRADRLVCRRLELRSMVIVPVRVQGRPAGLLEVFSSRAHAFQSSDVMLLRRIAELVAGIAAREPVEPPSAPPGAESWMEMALLDPISSPASQAEPARPSLMDEILTLDVEEAVAPVPSAETPKPQPAATPAVEQRLPPETTVRARPAPAVEQLSGKTVPPPLAPPPLTQPEGKRELEKMPERAASMVEKPAAAAEVRKPVATTVPRSPTEKVVLPPIAASLPVSTPDVDRPRAVAGAAAAVRAPVKPEAALEKEDTESPVHTSEPEAALPTLMEVRRPASNLRFVGAGILVTVLIVGAWQGWRAMAPTGGRVIDRTLERVTPGAPPAMTLPAPSVTANPTTAPDSAATTPAEGKPGTPPPAAVAVKAAPRPNNVPVEIATEEEVAVSEPITLPPPNLARARAKPEVAEAPSPLSLATRPEAPAIANLLRAPAVAPTLDAPQVSQFSGGKLLKKYDPIYPPLAAGLSGEVVLKASINREGKVSKVQVISGPPLLAQAAVSAVQRWRYEPFLLNGSPIEVENTIVVNFRTPRR